MISRRLFLALTGAAILAPRSSGAADEVPAVLDHIILGCSDLDRGIAFVEEHTGVRAALGGVHSGRGTRNALLALGERHYFEIMAPDPKQDKVEPYAVPQLTVLTQLTTPRLIGWGAHPGDIEALAKRLRATGISFHGPWPGSRARPDGHVLFWKTLSLDDDRHGLLPFFIEWGAASIHPSTDSSVGCQLEHFAVVAPDPRSLVKTFQDIGIDVPVERGEKPQLRARITGPKGKFEVRS